MPRLRKVKIITMYTDKATEELVNEWLEDNTDVTIESMEYQVSAYIDKTDNSFEVHSVLILYTKET